MMHFRFAPRLLLLSGLFFVACTGRPRSDDGSGKKLSGAGYVAVVDLTQGAPESTVGSGLFPLPAARTYLGLVRAIERMGSDEEVQSVMLDFGGTSLGMIRASEVAIVLEAVRKRGKRVVCHTHHVDNAAAWLLLRGCDESWVSAAGDVSTVGIAAELNYLQGAFEKLDIQADMLAMGKYKSGGEALTRKEPSEPSLRNLQATLSDLREQWLSGATQGAENPEVVKDRLEDGPWTPQRAEELGLITHVGFEDEALTSAKKAAGTEETRKVFGPGAAKRSDSNLAELVRLFAGADERAGGRKRIAVVPLIGSITMDSTGPFGDPGITAAATTRTIRRLREDDAVRALVLRIDSPGGSPLASDLIWREVMLTREKKPVIVSIGSMAASGGYYIASAGSQIVSSPIAIVGSIGVFGGKIVLRGAFEKLGITTHSVAASPEEGAAARALHMSPMTPWNEATRERVRQSMKRIYDLFVARVAEGRDMEKADVHATAEGAILLATVGKERGLVDELGGIDKALEIARREAKLPDDVSVTIDGPAESLIEMLLLGPEPDASEVETALLRYHRRLERARGSVLEATVVEALRPFSAAVAPLLSGEQVVAALPFALTIE